MQNRVGKMEALVDRLHGEQLRENGDSNAAHVRRVRTILLAALIQNAEQPDDSEVLEMAALGHDLLEDTTIAEADLKSLAGEDALSFIKELTNKDGDLHAEGYIRQMRSASEEARLIKYADLCDNLFHASYSARVLGPSWMRDYFLPIVDPMREALNATTFKKFPKTAALLRGVVSLARTHLAESTGS